MTETRFPDFPKLECPYIRKNFTVDSEYFKMYGSKYNMRSPQVYLCVDEVNPGYEWVFEDEDTIAIEKLNGTNIGIEMQNKRLISVQNRQNVVDINQIVGGRWEYMSGIFMAAEKGYIKPEGVQYGELIGPKLQGNPYGLDRHLWYPFDQSLISLKYNSWGKYPKTFQVIQDWFQYKLLSIFYQKWNKIHLFSKNEEGSTMMILNIPLAEGVVFYNLRRREQGKEWRAKLRRDMFPFFYEGIKF